MSNMERVRDEYPEEFCSLLEVAYGRGFLSEGGTDAIDDIIRGFEHELQGRRILEIGCGLGGATLHLAKRLNANVIGLEINQAIVDEANRRRPAHLRDKVEIVYYNDVNRLPFDDASFDFVFTKEVLLHLDTKEKASIMREVARVLRPGKHFIAVEWLSPVSGRWGPRVEEAAQADGLTMFAHTEEDYRAIAHAAGLSVVSMESRNDLYAAYNHDIAAHLRKPDVLRALRGRFIEETIQTNIHGYELLSEAIDEDELLIRRIVYERT